MKQYRVVGGVPLNGCVRLGGAKNSSYKLMIAALLGTQESRLLNFSRISDVEEVAQIIEQLGGGVRRAGERALYIQPDTLHSYVIKPSSRDQGRSTTLFIPVLVAKFGEAIVPLPGGDQIGKRPLDRHLAGLEAMGVRLERFDGVLKATADQLVGTTYRFEKNSHTGTETLLLAAVLAKGTTVLENAAEEPEIDDLINFLNDMGAHIRRRPGRIIEITGQPNLTGAIHQIMPDRNEAVSYACAALMTKGDIVIENAREADLTAFLDAVRAIGGGYEVGQYGIRFFYKGQLRATDIVTQVHPGFMTDWQPLFTTVLTQCQGQSIIHETIHQDRFQHVIPLVEMGAQIELFNPAVEFPDKTYNFNLADDHENAYHAIRISGSTPLHGIDMTVHDLRHGATLLNAAMAASGTSVIQGVHHIDRGYEELSTRLISMGAHIEQQESESAIV